MILRLISGHRDCACGQTSFAKDQMGDKGLVQTQKGWDSAVFQARVVPFMHTWFPFMLMWWAVQWWHVNGGLACGRVGDR